MSDKYGYIHDVSIVQIRQSLRELEHTYLKNNNKHVFSNAVSN